MTCMDLTRYNWWRVGGAQQCGGGGGGLQHKEIKQREEKEQRDGIRTLPLSSWW